MHVYRICNSTHYINAHHTIVYTYLYNYIVKIFINHYQPLRTMMNEMCDFSRHFWSEMCCLAGVSLALHYLHQRGFMAGGFFPLGKAAGLFEPHGGRCQSSYGLHQQTIIQYLDGDEVEIAGELLSKSSLHRPSPNHFMTFVIRSCSGQPHCACCCGCCWCCCCSRCRCCYCRCFCFCCFDLADSVETWMLCTLGAFGLTRIPGALYLTLFC